MGIGTLVTFPSISKKGQCVPSRITVHQNLGVALPEFHFVQKFSILKSDPALKTPLLALFPSLQTGFTPFIT